MIDTLHMCIDICIKKICFVFFHCTLRQKKHTFNNNNNNVSFYYLSDTDLQESLFSSISN